MRDNDYMIRILGDMMQRLQLVAHEKNVPIADLVNQALDDFLSYHETGISFFDIINSIENHLTAARHFVTNVDLYNNTISVKSPIRYVYRPELKYNITITQNSQISIGKMSVALRSNDISIIHCFSAFLNLWIELERKYIRQPERIEYLSDTGYFERKVYLPANDREINGQAVGAAISDYISVFDELLKRYFFGSDESEIERIYLDFIQGGKLRI